MTVVVGGGDQRRSTRWRRHVNVGAGIEENLGHGNVILMMRVREEIRIRTKVEKKVVSTVQSKM